LIDVVNNGAHYTPYQSGNNGTFNFVAPNLDRDSINLRFSYINKKFQCTNLIPNIARIKVKKFYGGPYMRKGAAFTGHFGQGTAGNPDAGKAGDVLAYELVPPSGLTNAQYGTAWTV